jgi:hypothetical protein
MEAYCMGFLREVGSDFLVFQEAKKKVDNTVELRATTTLPLADLMSYKNIDVTEFPSSGSAGFRILDV